MDNNSITVAICTYKRMFLSNTIQSVIESVKRANSYVTIVIVDNDLEKSALCILAEFNGSEHYSIKYYNEPSVGVVNARNKVISIVDTDWLISIDDDEVVDINWYENYLTLVNDCKVEFDAAVGPVITQYPDFVNKTIINSKIHDRKEYSHLKKISHGATNNCLLRVSLIKDNQLNFDIKFNFTGAEDSDFFERFNLYGKIIWNNKSIVYEPLTRERSTESWIFNRLYCNGKNYGVRKIIRKGHFYRFYLFFSSVIKLIQHMTTMLFFICSKSKVFRMKCEVLRDLGRISSSISGVK
ncbi:glycosyltransferase family 2 protein [Shewanella sp. S1-58-MNA-CIBAN-0166]|uniref:glycosyltransferase family 2 protein n=1 Tax=Shewanella sp. S1-58-MNA-CIBAN-0166 TaxID=3140467 RepID=UPI003316F549